jgi:alkanesulfonate monooxygenase SsuD/methylene tetrahydromethanopterin reductase-like flavin-dependent oxidoreductase (luciferase family)
MQEKDPKKDQRKNTVSSRPFERGSISLRLYPHNELEAVNVVDELCAQARLALESGFDGVMTSEHHGGVGGYLPNPLQMAAFVLEQTDTGWAAPCPLLLPLRPTALVAEEIAWLNARHPGRVGLGVASGALPLDFEVMGLDVRDATRVFKAELPRIVEMLRGQGLGGLGGDRALQRCAVHPIPVLSAAVSVTAARRGARCGAGLILEGMSAPEKVAELCAAFDEAGGTLPKILVRRVWLGPPQAGLVEEQRRFYQSYRVNDEPLPADQTISAPDGLEMAARLADLLEATGADGLNLRIHLPGMPAGAVREQIAGLASAVLPGLRSRAVPPR